MLFVLAGGMLVVLAVLSHRQASHWLDIAAVRDHLVQINPRSIAGHRVNGFMRASKGDYPGAIECYQAALAVRPDDVETHYNLGKALLVTHGNPDETFKHLTIAYNGFTSDNGRKKALAGVNLALFYSMVGQEMRAWPLLCEAIQLDPNNVEAHNNMGVILKNSGRFNEAIDQFQEALRLDPGYQKAQIGLNDAFRRRSMMQNK